MKNPLILLTGCAIGIFVINSHSQAPQYPETLWVPVTYYDFHWNYRAGWDQPVTIFHGNTDFEPIGNLPGMLIMGMVADTLDNEFKPILGSTIYFSAGIQYWFRPWKPGLFLRPAYRPDGALSSWLATSYDTVYKNIVIPDSLPFLLTDSAAGTYVFDSDVNEPYASIGGFFPINHRGFGTEGAVDSTVAPWGHNYSFTMEMHQPIQYKAGMVFEFASDNDMWVFINKKLVLDLGGINSRQSGSFSLDAAAASLGLVAGRVYALSVFYVERHVTGASCKITTHLFTPQQLSTQLELVGNDTLTAGVPTEMLRVRLLDQSGNPVQDSIADKATWEIKDHLPGDSLLNTIGNTVTVLAVKAWRNMTIIATCFIYPIRMPIRMTRQIWVKPGPADHVVIEQLTNDTGVADLNADSPLAFIDMPLITDSAKVYAIVRDQFQNFVTLGSAITWSVQDPAKAVVAGDVLKNWIGWIKRPATWSALIDSTIITASTGSLRPASVKAVIEYRQSSARPRLNTLSLRSKTVVDIYSISGRLIARSFIPSNGNLSLSLIPLHLPAGMYLCKVKTPTSSRLKQAWIQGRN